MNPIEAWAITGAICLFILAIPARVIWAALLLPLAVLALALLI